MANCGVTDRICPLVAAEIDFVSTSGICSLRGQNYVQTPQYDEYMDHVTLMPAKTV